MRPELIQAKGCWAVYRHAGLWFGPVKIVGFEGERLVVLKVTGEVCRLPEVFLDNNWEEVLAPGATVVEEAEAILRGVKVSAVKDGRRV